MGPKAARRRRSPAISEPPATSVAINHTTQLPLLFHFGPRFRPSVSALGFRASSAQWHPTRVPWHRPHDTHMETGVAQLHSIAQIRITCSMFKLLFIANATRSRSTLRRNMVEYQHSRGPKPRAEITNSRENSNPFSALGREHLSLLREFSRLYVKFRPSVQILFKRGFRSQFRQVVKTTCRILQILQSVKFGRTGKNDSTETTFKGSGFFSRPNRSCSPSRPGCCLC